MRVGLLVAVLASQLSAQSAGADFFEKKIRPVLAANCCGCHSSRMKTPMGGLALDTKSGTSKVVQPGNPAPSRLLRAITDKDLHLKMPRTGPLPDAVVAHFQRVDRIRRIRPAHRGRSRCLCRAGDRLREGPPPEKYESYVDLEPGVWTKFKIEVEDRKARLSCMERSNLASSSTI